MRPVSGKTRKKEEKALSKILRWALIPFVFLVDRIFKIWIVLRLKEGEGFPVWRGVFHVTRVNNTGAAFGLWHDSSLFLTTVTALSVLAILFYLVCDERAGRNNKNFYAWSLVAGGALGNLYDRVLFGYVIDFLDFRAWPVFNVADASICVGVFFILLSVFYASDPL